MSDWWLIHDKTVKIIREGLQAVTHLADDFNCPDRNDGCSGCEGDALRQRALYCVETGLNLTQSVPDDFKEWIECDSCGMKVLHEYGDFLGDIDGSPFLCDACLQDQLKWDELAEEVNDI